MHAMRQSMVAGLEGVNACNETVHGGRIRGG